MASGKKGKKDTRKKAGQSRAAKGGRATPRAPRKRRSEVPQTRPCCPVCRVPLPAVATPPDGTYDPALIAQWLRTWEWGGCTRCSPEELNMLKLTVGGAYDISDPLEVPPFDVVDVTPDIAKRAVYRNRTKHIEETTCGCFFDEQTGKWYAQPIPQDSL
jgi:hypothetical protein